MRLHSALRARFGIDIRSLAALRIGVGLLVLADLAGRAPDLVAHYTDAGVLPRYALMTGLMLDTRTPLVSPVFFLHMVSGHAAVTALLFGIAGVVAIGLIVGFRTTLATALSWILLSSLHARNPLVLQGGDILLRMLLFWGMFLPLGCALSIDRARRRCSPGPESTAFSVGSAALLMQVAIVYLFAVAVRMHPIWWEGQGLFYALQFGHHTSAWGQKLLAYPGILWILSYGAVILELVGPLLALLVSSARVRVFVVLSFVGFHLGISALMDLGLFPAISMVSWIPFIPGQVWDRLGWGWDGGSTYGRRVGTSGGASILAQIVAGTALLAVFVWNIDQVRIHYVGRRLMPVSLSRLTSLAGIGQRWSFFALRSPLDRGWYVLAGRTWDGAVAALRGSAGSSTWTRPALVSETYPSNYWRKYLEALSRPAMLDLRPHFLEYECRMQAAKGRELAAMDLYFVREPVLLDGSLAPAERELMYRHDCSLQGGGRERDGGPAGKLSEGRPPHDTPVPGCRRAQDG